MVRTTVALFLLVSLGFSVSAGAQPQPRKAVGVTVAWTAAGAGAGFGVGLWAGLTAFDDAINSDRKVWTSALVGAGIGALGGYLIAKAVRRDAQPGVGPAVTGSARTPAVQKQVRGSVDAVIIAK